MRYAVWSAPMSCSLLPLTAILALTSLPLMGSWPHPHRRVDRGQRGYLHPSIPKSRSPSPPPPPQPMASMPLKTPADRGYIIPERLGRTMIYHINEEGEGMGEKPEATAVGKGLGSLGGAGGVEVAGAVVVGKGG